MYKFKYQPVRTSLLFIVYVNISYCLKSRVCDYYRICFCIKTRMFARVRVCVCVCVCVVVCACVNENRAPREVCSRWQQPDAASLLPHPFWRPRVAKRMSLRPEQWQCDSFSVLEPRGKRQPSTAGLHGGASVKLEYKALRVCSSKPRTRTARVRPKPSGELGGWKRKECNLFQTI